MRDAEIIELLGKLVGLMEKNVEFNEKLVTLHVTSFSARVAAMGASIANSNERWLPFQEEMSRQIGVMKEALEVLKHATCPRSDQSCPAYCHPNGVEKSSTAVP